MSYATIHRISQSQSLRNRCAAAAAEQGVPAGEEDHWVYTNALRLAAQPGWAAAWESAVENGVEDPGADPGVLTDGMILSAVQVLLGVEVPPVEESP